MSACVAPGCRFAKQRALPSRREQGKRRQLVRYRPIIRIHDLRHTFASHLVSRGESLHIVGKLLGHTRPETTACYAHLSDESLRTAVNRFGEIFQNGKKEAVH